MSTSSHDTRIRRAAEVIRRADALVLGAGAGMGVDSGLSDFRGDQGFWRAYPSYQELGLSFIELANPVWFATDPTLAWGFYGHRLMLYRGTAPHEGFEILRRWSERACHGAFVFTSNVDGHFQAAGFDPNRVVECHGSIHWMQCTRRCGAEPFSAGPRAVTIDENTMRAATPLPECLCCGALARPNVLMFGDWDWDAERADAQQHQFERWLGQIHGSNVAVIECGAGRAVPTVRRNCEFLATRFGGTLIRINPHDAEVPDGHIGLPLGALECLRAIDARLSAS